MGNVDTRTTSLRRIDSRKGDLVFCDPQKEIWFLVTKIDNDYAFPHNKCKWSLSSDQERYRLCISTQQMQVDIIQVKFSQTYGYSNIKQHLVMNQNGSPCHPRYLYNEKNDILTKDVIIKDTRADKGGHAISSKVPAQEVNTPRTGGAVNIHCYIILKVILTIIHLPVLFLI